MIRIVVVDEHQVEKDAITNLLIAQNDFEIVGLGNDGYDALRLVRTLKPDIALLGEHLALIDTAEAIPMIKNQSPKTGIIILTVLSEEDHILKAIRNGASGYLAKHSGEDWLITGIRTVYHGGSLMSPEIVAKAFQQSPKINSEQPIRKAVPSSQQETQNLPANISRQELRLITYIGQGLSNKEIAAVLRLKDGTIRNYITSIFQKTGLRNRTQVARFAYSIGLEWISPGTSGR